MLTLKERLEHGDLDNVLSREDVKEILALYNDNDCEDRLNFAYEDGRSEGYSEGKDEGFTEGEESWESYVQNKYIEIVNDAPERQHPIVIIGLLDTFFKVKIEDGIRVAR